MPSVDADVDMPSFGMKGKPPGIDAKFDKPSLDVGSDFGGGVKLGGTGGLPGVSAKGGMPSVGADVDMPSVGLKGKQGVDAKFDKPSLDIGSDIGGGLKLGGTGGVTGLSAKGGLPSVGADVDMPSVGLKGKPELEGTLYKPSLTTEVGGPSVGLDTGVQVGKTGVKIDGSDRKADKNFDLTLPKSAVRSDIDIDEPSVKLGGKGGDGNIDLRGAEVGVPLGKSDLSPSHGKLDAEASLPSTSVTVKEPKKKGIFGGFFKKSKKSGHAEIDVPPLKVADVRMSSDVRSPQVSLGETRPLSGEFGLKAPGSDADAAGTVRVDGPSMSHRASVGLDKPAVKAEAPQITAPGLQIGGGKGGDGSIGFSQGGKLNAALPAMDIGNKVNVDQSHDVGMSLTPPRIEQHSRLPNVDAGVKVGGTGDLPEMSTKGSVPSVGFKGKDEIDATLDKPSVNGSLGGPSLSLGPKFSGDAGKAKLSGVRVSKTVEIPSIDQQAGIEFGQLEMTPDFDDTELTTDIPRGHVEATASLPSASISAKETPEMGGLDGKQPYKFYAPGPQLTGELGDASLSGASSVPTVDVHGGKAAEVDVHKKGGFSFGSLLRGKKHEKSADLNAGLPGATVDKNAQIHATLPGTELSPVSRDKQGSVGGHVTLPKSDLNTSLEPSFSPETSAKVSMPTVRADVDSPSGKLAAPSIDISGGKTADVGARKKGGLLFGGLFGNKKHDKSADLSVGLPEAGIDNKSKLHASLPDAEVSSGSLDKQGSLGGHLAMPKANLDASHELSFSRDTSAKVSVPAVTAAADSPSGKVVAPSLDLNGEKSSDLNVHKTGGLSLGTVFGKTDVEKSADVNVSLPRASLTNEGQIGATLPEAELPSVSVGKHGSVVGKAELTKPEIDTEFKTGIVLPNAKVAGPSADINVDKSTDVDVHKKGGFSFGGIFGGKKHEKSADLNVSLPEANIDKRSSVGGHVDMPKPELDASVAAGLSSDTSPKVSLPTVEADVDSPSKKMTAPSIDVHGGKSADIGVNKKGGLFGGIFGGKKRDESAGFSANLPESSVDGDGEFHATLPKGELPSASVGSAASSGGSAEFHRPTLETSLAPGAMPDGYGKVSLPDVTTDIDAPSISARADKTVDVEVQREGELSFGGLSIGKERTAGLDVTLPAAQAPSVSTGSYGSAGGHFQIEKPGFGASVGSTDVHGPGSNIGANVNATAPAATVIPHLADIGLSSKAGATSVGGFGKSKSVDVPDVNLRTQGRSLRAMGATVDAGDESSFGLSRASDFDVETKRAGDVTVATSGRRFAGKYNLDSPPEIESNGSDLSFGVPGVNFDRSSRSIEASSYRETVTLDTKSPKLEGTVEGGEYVSSQSTKIAVGSGGESGSVEVGREMEKRRVSSGVLGRRQSSGRSGLDIRPGDIEKAVVSLGTREEPKADVNAAGVDLQSNRANVGGKPDAMGSSYASKGSDFMVDRVEETTISPMERKIHVKTVKTTTYTVTRDADEEEDEETYDFDRRPVKTTVAYRAVEGDQDDEVEQEDEDADEDDEASLESGQFYFNVGDNMDLNAEAMIKQIGFHPITFPDGTLPPTHNGDDEDEDTQEEEDVEESIEDPESRWSASGPRSSRVVTRSRDPDSKITVRQSAHSSDTVTSFSSAPTSVGYVSDLTRLALTPVDLPSDDETNDAETTLTAPVDDDDETVDAITSPQMVTSQLTVRLSNGSGAAPTHTEEKRSREIVFIRSGTSSTTTTASRSTVVTTTTTTEKRTDDLNNNFHNVEFSSDA